MVEDYVVRQEQFLAAQDLRELQRQTASEQKKTEEELRRPSVVYRPSIFIDGNQWCALYGENLQEGVAGFGDSPGEAMQNFDEEWYKKLEVKKPSCEV